MKITVTENNQKGPVTILHLDGTLDGSNYELLIEEAHKQYAAGARNLILDLSRLVFISSAGLGALHQAALLFQGKKRAERDESWADYRWSAYRSEGGVRNLAIQESVKLLSPSKEVREVLDMIGFTSLFEIYDELDPAIASFFQAVPVNGSRPS